jgi:hypothetical protein
MTKATQNFLLFRINLENKSSVETWLNSIADAEFVITDSFHGCVFLFCLISLSLLKLFQLENRLIFSSEQVKKVLTEEINWNKVNSILEEKRKESVNFLTDVLQ